MHQGAHAPQQYGYAQPPPPPPPQQAQALAPPPSPVQQQQQQSSPVVPSTSPRGGSALVGAVGSPSDRIQLAPLLRAGAGDTIAEQY